MRTSAILAGLIVTALAAGGAIILFTGGERPLEARTSPVVSRVEAAVENSQPATQVRRGNCGSAGGGCGSSGSGQSCCGGSGNGTTASGEKIEMIRTYLLQHYTKLLGNDVLVEVKDLGCHQEAEIRHENRIIKRLSINGASITDIT